MEISNLEESAFKKNKSLKSEPLFLELKWSIVKQYITLEQASQINMMIRNENRANWEHMLERSDEKVMTRANQAWCRVLLSWDEVIWFVYNTPIQFKTIDWVRNSIFEIWWWIRKAWYWWKWIWSRLFKELLLWSQDIPIIAVSNQNHVINLFISNGLQEINVRDDSFPKNIPIDWSKILEDDHVYWNKKMIDLVLSQS